MRPQHGAELADLLDDGGVPDEQKIRQAVESARRELGIETPRPPIKSLRSGDMVHHPKIDDWKAAFSPRRER